MLIIMFLVVASYQACLKKARISFFRMKQVSNLHIVVGFLVTTAAGSVCLIHFLIPSVLSHSGCTSSSEFVP